MELTDLETVALPSRGGPPDSPGHIPAADHSADASWLRRKRRLYCWAFVAATALAIAAIGVALGVGFAPSGSKKAPSRTRIGFASCTRYDQARQPVWHSIVAAEPDAFLMSGDLAYLDDPVVDCAQSPER